MADNLNGESNVGTEDSIGLLMLRITVERYLYDVVSGWRVEPHIYVVQEPSLSSLSYF